MTGTNATPAITMKVFMERDRIAPVRVILKGHVGAKDCPASLPVT